MEIRRICTLNTKLLSIFFGLLEFTNADVFCGANSALFSEHVRFCYGVTAYCCGFRDAECCWDSIWKIWWFWVIVLVVLGALFSCIGYFCTCMNDDWNNSGRVSPFYAIRDGFRRRFSSDRSGDVDDPYKNYGDRAVRLPPYYPSTSTVALSTANASRPYPDSPPPYTEEVANSESVPLLPTATTSTVPTTTQADVTSYPTAPPSVQ